MTRTTNARIAGVTFLSYIALGIPAMVLTARATGKGGIPEQLATIAQHASDYRVAVLLGLATVFCAVVLAVTMYAITRDQDRDLAMLGLVCRAGEGIVGAISVQSSLGLLWLATAIGADKPSPEGLHTLGAFLLKGQGSGLAAILFSVGSTVFAWLLLRGRMVPAALAWLGVIASAAAVVMLPLNFVGLIPTALTWGVWIPLAVFEISLSLWFLVKGVRPAAPVAGRPLA